MSSPHEVSEGMASSPGIGKVIDSIKELDDLPLGAVIQDSNGIVYRRTEGHYYDGPHDWQTFDGYFWDIVDFVMPVTLIALNAYSASKVSVPERVDNARSA